jgi:hypothetical protein
MTPIAAAEPKFFFLHASRRSTKVDRFFAASGVVSAIKLGGFVLPPSPRGFFFFAQI